MMMSDEEIEMWIKNPDIIENGAKIQTKRELMNRKYSNKNSAYKFIMTMQASDSFHKPFKP